MRRCHISYGPQATGFHEDQDQNPHGLDGDAGSGVQPLTSIDAGLPPATRLSMFTVSPVCVLMILLTGALDTPTTALGYCKP